MKQFLNEDNINTWSGKSIWQMAKEVGFGEQYNSVYTLGSILTHSSSRSANEYVKLVNGELEWQTFPSDTYVNESLIAAFENFYYIVGYLSDLFKLNLEGELTDLEKRLKEHFPLSPNV